MRHKYDTRGIVLARSPQGEANALLAVLSKDLGLVRARAQGVRRPGAKLAAALATFAQSELVLVKGAEGWRIAGAVLDENHVARLSRDARERAGRVAGLMLRLSGEGESGLFDLFAGLVAALDGSSEAEGEALEILAVLRVLGALGLDSLELPAGADSYAPAARAAVEAGRAAYIARINRGIEASGL